MIETHSLIKSFGAKRALDDVTVTLPAGTVTALLGLNGAGKTTLLRLIAGLDRPDGGTVTVCGRKPFGDPRLVGAHLGPDALDPRHTVTRHLRWLAALAGVNGTRVGQVLEETGLSSQRRDRIATLSLGARQRLAVAGVLLCRPRAVLFDEPLNGLDVPGIVWFRGLLRQLADAGCAVEVVVEVPGRGRDEVHDGLTRGSGFRQANFAGANVGRSSGRFGPHRKLHEHRHAT